MIQIRNIRFQMFRIQVIFRQRSGFTGPLPCRRSRYLGNVQPLSI
jgi:hypothetical protein